METKNWFQAIMIDQVLPSFFYQVDGSGHVLLTRDEFGNFATADVTTIFAAFTNFSLAAGEQFLETNVMPFHHLRTDADFSAESFLFSQQSQMENQLWTCGFFGELPTPFTDPVSNVMQNLLSTPAKGWASQFPSGDSTKLYDLIERSRDLNLENYNIYLPLANQAKKSGNPELITGLLADVGTTTLGSWKSEYPLIYLLLTVKPIVDAIKADRFGVLGASTPAISTIFEEYFCTSCIDFLAQLEIVPPFGGFLWPYNGLHFAAYNDYKGTSLLQDGLFIVTNDDPLNTVFLNDLSYYTGYYGCWPPMFARTYDPLTTSWDLGGIYTYQCATNPYLYC